MKNESSDDLISQDNFQDATKVQLLQINESLQQEIESLKSQFNKTLNFTNELQTMHEKNRLLTSQLIDTNQKIENITNHNELLQTKSKNFEQKLHDLSSKLEKEKQNKEELLLELAQQKKNNEKLQYQISSQSKTLLDNQNTQSRFFQEFSEHTNTLATSFQDILNFVSRIGNQQSIHEIIPQTLPKNDEVNQRRQDDEKKRLRKKLQTSIQENESLKQQVKNLNARINQNDSKEQRQKSTLEKLTNDLENALFQKNQLENTLYSVKLDYENQIKDIKYELAQCKSVKDIEAQQMQNSKLNESCSEYEVQVSQQKKIIKNLQNLVQATSEKTKTQYNKINKLNHKISDLNAEIKNLKENNRKAQSEETKYQTKITEYEEKIQSFQLEVEFYKTNIDKVDSNAQMMDNEITKQKTTIDLMEKQLVNYANEVTKLHNERQRIIDIVQKLFSLCLKYESLNNQIPTTIINKSPKPTQNRSPCRKPSDPFAEVILAFHKHFIPLLDTDLNEKCNKILFNDKAEPRNRFLEFCKEVAEETHKEPEIIEREVEKLEDHRVQQLSFLIKSTIHGFKSILDISEDENIVNFLSKKIKEFETVLTDEDLILPEMLSLQFLFNGTLDDRRKVIQSLANKGFQSDDAFNLFVMMCLVNIENQKLSQRLENEVSCLESENNNLQEIVKNITAKHQELYKRHKKMKRALQEQAESEKVVDYSPLIQEKDDEIRALQNELKFYQERNKNEINMKNQRIEMLELNRTKIETDHKKQIDELESVIQSKNNEISKLTSQLYHQNVQLDSIKQKSDQQKNVVNQMNEKIENIESRRKNKIKKLQQRIKSLQETQKQQIEEMTNAHEETEKQLREAITKKKQNEAEKEELSIKLSESLKTSEKRNQKLMKEISQLIMQKKTLEEKITNLREEAKREIQVKDAQFSVFKMSAETSKYEECEKLRMKYIAEQNSLIIKIMNEFDELEQIETDVVNPENFLDILRQISEEYKELKSHSYSCYN